MGDGGVACVPSQHVVERFPEAFCAGGGSNGNGFSSKAVQLADSTSSSSQHQQQRKNENNMEVEREGFSLGKGQNGQFKKGEFGEEEKLWKGESEREESGLEKQRKGEVRKEDLVSGKRPRGKGEKLRKGAVEKGEIVLENSRKGDIEKGEIVPERWCKGVEGEREEFSSEKVCKSEFKKGDSSFEKLRKGDIEKGEITSRKWRKEEVEKGERILDEWQKEEIEKGEIVPEKWQKEELEKGEFVPDKWRKGEVEKGEIVSERRRKGESTKEEFGSGRSRRWEVEKGEFVPEKGRNRDRETPPSVKFMDEDVPQRNGSSRSGSERRKRSSRWEAAHERDSKNCSRIMDDESGLYKSEYGDEKSRIKDYMSGAWLKRHGPESESSSRRYSVDDYLGSKSRRISDDNNHSGYSDKLHLRSSVESSYRNVSLSSRVSSTSRYTSRHNDTSSSSRGHDRHGRSPGHSERSPHNRARYHDHRDRSPTHLSDRHGRSPGHSERSPHNRARHYDHKDRSPGHLNDRHGRSPAFSERSPHNLVRNYDHRDRSPGHLGYSERSPHVRCRHHDHKDRSPVRSPRDRPRHRDHRDRTPLYLERSPYDPGRINDNRDTNRKTGGNEKHNSRYGSQGQEEKPGRKDSGGRDSHRHVTSRQSNNNTCLANDSSCPDKNFKDPSYKEKETQNEIATCSEVPSQVSETPEELPSMEEDMDICDTPPHAPIVADSTLGNWFYLDHFGMEQGPSKLHDLKRLVEEGFLQSDHLIKHSESDRWVTVENAASPLVPNNFPSIFSDTETQMVNPPEAPGNLLVDAGDVGQSANQPSLESSNSSLQPLVHRDEGPVVTESLEDLHIDERVGALLKGYTVIPGRELESLGEALQTMFEHAEWEKWGNLEGFSRSRPRSGESSGHPRDEESGRGIEGMHKETVETRFLAPPEKDYSFLNGDSSDWSSSLWSCKGGDWKRNDDTIQERSTKRKLVLNEGYPLCQMPKSGYEDPRWHRKDDLYHPSRNRRLDLPHWAFTISDEKNDINGDQSKSILAGRSNQLKAPLPRGVRGTLLPVVRINACVVKDHGPFASDTRSKVRSNERHGSRPIRSYSASGDSKSSISDGVARSKAYERDLQLQALLTGVNAPKDRVCTVDELHLNLGDWYYLDGAGHERGPSLLSELQALVSQGIIQKNTSVFRKFDKIWVPITPAAIVSESVLNQEGQEVPTADSSVVPLAQQQADHSLVDASSSFHNLHPQFIGYMRGKLHELVMKSYRSREFAAAINEVLDPWMNANQPKKETDKHFPFNSAITKSSSGLAYDLMNKVQKSEDDYTRAGKRARLLADGSEDDDDDDEMEEDLLIGHNDTSFEDLCSETSHGQENISTSKTETESWGLLNGRILARVFHHLRMDLKSLATSAATCKCWNAAVKFYRDISRQVDLSSIGPNCTDSMFWNIMSYYDKTKITSVVLVGCTNVSAGALQEVLQSFSSITSVDIRGCSQFRELRNAFKNVKWIRSHGSHSSKISEESNSKMRSLKQITDKSYLNSKAFKGSSSNLNDSSKMMDSFDYYSSLDWKDLSNHAFGRSCYKRTKLLNARKSSSILSRDARMRRWLHRKSENGYKMMEEFLVLSLKDIMRENTCQFFITKVPEIEDKMKNGYYIRRGLSSFKDDISRMCRDAIKAKSRGGSGDMKRIILLFLQLLTSLEENSNKSCNERDEMIKMLKDSSLEGSTTSKYKKKHNKILNEGRGMPRNNGTSYVNGGHDYGDYDASDREIRRRLSKLNKRTMESESETSDDHDLFEEDRGDAENSDSETETDPDIHSEAGTGDSRGLPFVDDEALDSEEHEWGARMTEASLVPPVTRKYEVIDRYVIVADEDEVQRKMRVALPDDYIEKLSAQKNGTEESDMEIPEVKDYKPRKKVGDEVLEQEVYGIDPYTHNLLLDSMPKEDPEWPLLEKHSFIEEVLLRALNQRVRHFTGTGNAPMIYPLRPVVEEILKGAEEGGDTRIMKMCQEILKAMQNRSSTKYVAYRKGLGVVCNKEEGFGEDDFVVEFLGEVYPSWKWFEKQDGIRSLQKDSKDPAPEFYNIYLERPKGDRDGYDLVVVDAMHKANYASRICHSCRPNCEAKVTAVDGQYQIGIYTVRAIRYGEEITFDYNSVTESKEEYEKSVCLCGSQVCRGSYLNLTGEGAFQKVLKECHGILDRHRLMLESCDMNSVSEEDYVDLRRAGLGTCLLSGLPDWLIAYSAHLVRFINFERTKLPDEILKHNLGEKRKLYSDSEICLELEKSDAEIQAEGVYNQRLQNLALTLDKVRYAMRCVFGDPKIAPPPLEKISPEDLVSLIWKGEGSLVEELVLCIAPHTEADLLDELKSKIRAHDPSGSDDIQRQLQKSLLWLRDELRDLPCTHKCRHDAAADLIHMYAYTKCFFRVRDYKSFTSPPVYISPDDLCPKYADKLGSGFQEYCKKYGENYCLGQLIYWHNQANAEPDCSLSKARRGCVSLPDVSSFYAKSQKLSYKRVYGPRTVKFMLSRMEKDPQRPWPKDKIWTFKSAPQILGSPMLDAVMNKSALDKEMVHWLKCRRPCSMPRDG